MTEQKTEQEKKIVYNIDKLDQYSNELPCLVLKFKIGTQDFVKKEIHLEARGKTISEAREGLNKLIRELNKLLDKS